MRYFGQRELPSIPVLPDTVLSLLLTANSGQAFDYPVTADLVRVTPGSTIQGVSHIVFNPISTGAVQPTTAGVIVTSANSSGLNILIGVGDSRMFQRPRGSTGFSLICPSSLPVSVEFWTRTGATSST